MNRAEILETAYSLTTGDRNRAYGDPVANFATYADLVNACFGTAFDATDASILMALMKISRITVNKGHMDNYVDGAAYFGIAGECAARLAENAD